MVMPVSELEELVTKRRDFLAALSESPATKPELVERLDTSRSTVDRGISDLEHFDFVCRPADQYQLTMAGRAAYERHQSYLDDLRDIQRASDVISLLSPEVPFSFGLLEDAEIQVAESHDPHQPLELAADIMSKAIRVRKVSPAVFPLCVQALEEWMEDGRTVDLVVTSDVLETLTNRYRDEVSCLEHPEHNLYELQSTPPYALWVAETPEGEYTGLMPTSETGVEGLVITDSDDACRWALEQYESYLERATVVESLGERT
ncbi:transcriptional regulator FilR1 domain-containing protein [Salinibaculum salinum]|uniref:helix-turn-helix transcriptional regulator n=1 Tax=Salinibaculum salinum TaxID=3131996 RepID=UPI0030EB8548